MSDLSDLPVPPQANEGAPPPGQGELRLPPIEEFTEELHAAHGYRVGRHPEGPLMFVFGDFQHDTIQDWERWVAGYLQQVAQEHRREPHLYDLRRIHNIPIHTVQAAMRANSLPGAKNVRLGIVTRDSALATMIQTITMVTIGAEARFFTKMHEALAWLKQMHP